MKKRSKLYPEIVHCFVSDFIFIDINATFADIKQSKIKKKSQFLPQGPDFFQIPITIKSKVLNIFHIDAQLSCATITIQESAMVQKNCDYLKRLIFYFFLKDTKKTFEEQLRPILSSFLTDKGKIRQNRINL